MTQAVQQPANQYGEGFISAEDLLIDGTWKQVTLTISQVFPPNTVRAMGGKVLVDKPVLAFEKTEKRFAVGSTNQTLIHYATGASITKPPPNDTPHPAIGRKITIYPVSGKWFGFERLAGVRVRLPKNAVAPHVKAKNMGEDITGQSFSVESVDVKEVG